MSRRKFTIYIRFNIKNTTNDVDIEVFEMI